jgi:hypothetical protein
MNEVDNRSHAKNVLVVDVPIYYIYGSGKSNLILSNP